MIFSFGETNSYYQLTYYSESPKFNNMFQETVRLITIQNNIFVSEISKVKSIIIRTVAIQVNVNIDCLRRHNTSSALKRNHPRFSITNLILRIFVELILNFVFRYLRPRRNLDRAIISRATAAASATRQSPSLPSLQSSGGKKYSSRERP